MWWLADSRIWRSMAKQEPVPVTPEEVEEQEDTVEEVNDDDDFDDDDDDDEDEIIGIEEDATDEDE